MAPIILQRHHSKWNKRYFGNNTQGPSFVLAVLIMALRGVGGTAVAPPVPLAGVSFGTVVLGGNLNLSGSRNLFKSNSILAIWSFNMLYWFKSKPVFFAFLCRSNKCCLSRTSFSMYSCNSIFLQHCYIIFRGSTKLLIIIKKTISSLFIANEWTNNVSDSCKM